RMQQSDKLSVKLEIAKGKPAISFGPKMRKSASEFPRRSDDVIAQAVPQSQDLCLEPRPSLGQKRIKVSSFPIDFR
ncbi:Hypothetical predicted protein, partial [Pelobates cultripes]